MLQLEVEIKDLARRKSLSVQHLRYPGEGNQGAVAKQGKEEDLLDWKLRQDLDASQKRVVASKENTEGNTCDVPNYKNHKSWNQRPEGTLGVGSEGELVGSI
jgi:hypothetical protein